MPPAIELRDITKVYRTGLRRKPVVALDGVTLDVQPGEIFGFLGANGAGKTTAVKILLRLARPTKGNAHILGHRPGGRTRYRIGYVPESPYFYDFLTPNELLAYYGKLFGLGRAESKRRTADVLNRVGMAHRADAQLRTFSKGMVQRVGLAQSLLNDPEVLFLDEPTSGLDPLARREIRDIILSLKAHGTTVFLNSHLLSEVELICDRVGILRSGRLVKLGAVDDLVRRAGVEVVMRCQPSRVPGGLICEPGDDGTLTVVVEREEHLPATLRALLDVNATIVSVNPRRETLEDLFISIQRGEA